jgi:hypothetical protein
MAPPFTGSEHPRRPRLLSRRTSTVTFTTAQSEVFTADADVFSARVVNVL